MSGTRVLPSVTLSLPGDHRCAFLHRSNVLSFSDGAYGNSTGRVLMYMADMDSTVADLQVVFSGEHVAPLYPHTCTADQQVISPLAQANAQATLAVAEAQLSGGCGARDPEDPVCAKVVLMGHIVQVPDDYVPTAKEMVFARHPAMRAWHAHTYHVYELVVDKIRVLDYYGGYGWPSVAEYMAWTPDILA